MEKEKLFIWFFLLLNIFFVKCIKNDINSSINNIPSVKKDSIKMQTISKDKIFKTWLEDTLINLKKWKKKKEKNVVTKRITVGKDSLSLSTEIHYIVLPNEKDIEDSIISNVIDLVREYNELPYTSYKLSFKNFIFYQPSFAAKLNYDLIQEIKDIEIIEQDSRTKLKYIRGRLSGKEVIRNNKDGNQEVVKTDFIWKDNTLIKSERSRERH